jgi:small subunit ribosomal protein S7
MMEIKVFNKWSVEGIKVDDAGLVDYVSLSPRIVPKSEGRYIGQRFRKSQAFIVERLINKMMVTGHKAKKHFKTSSIFTGKGTKAYNIVKDTFEIVEQKTKKNPIEVFVRALENAAPREEVIAIEYGGARYPKAVECSPQRRIDIALRLMTQGAFHKRFNSKKAIENSLADEIIAAYNQSGNSAAIAKKLEVERQADASR